VRIRVTPKAYICGQIFNAPPWRPPWFILSSFALFAILKRMGANTGYKDSVFGKLFSDESLLREK
jgi:hypothetical protein